MSGAATHKKSGDRAVNILISFLVGTRWVLAVLIVPVALSIFTDALPLHFGADPLDPEADGVTVHLGVMVEENMTRAAVIAEAIKTVIYYGFAFYFIAQLLGILRNVRAGAPFARDNGARLRRIGYAGAAAQLSVYGVWVVFRLIDAFGAANVEGMVIELNPAPWIGVLSAFALATVFREGTQLKEEQDLTV